MALALSAAPAAAAAWQRNAPLGPVARALDTAVDVSQLPVAAAREVAPIGVGPGAYAV